MVRIIFCLLWLMAHPVHVSLLSIDYAPETVSFNVFLKIYYDDFLLDSGINDNDKKNLKFSDNDSFTKEVVGKYVNEKIRIAVNNKQLSGTIENIEMSDNEIRMNLSYNSARKISTITIKNLVNTSLYKDQVNMIITKVNDFEEGFKLTSDETERTFKIK